MNERGKTTWAPWILLLVLVVYPASSGPMHYLMGRHTEFPDWVYFVVRDVYTPLDWLLDNSPDWIKEPMWQYEVWWGELDWDDDLKKLVHPDRPN